MAGVAPKYWPCDDGDPCTFGTGCISGKCDSDSGVINDCDDGSPCTTDGCDSSAPGASASTGCFHKPKDGACNDGNACTKLDKCEFAVFTPYPNTPAWHRLVAEDRILHRTWKHYNDANVVFRPKQMSEDRLQRGYLDLWREFYSQRGELADRQHHARTVQF